MSKKILEKPDNCAICFEMLEEKNPLTCGHWLHVACVEKHFKPECPLCRAPLNIKVKGTHPSTDLIDMPIPDDMPDLENDDTIPVFLRNAIPLFFRHFPIIGNVVERGYESEDDEEEDDKGYLYKEEASDYDEENPNGDEWNYEDV